MAVQRLLQELAMTRKSGALVTAFKQQQEDDSDMWAREVDTWDLSPEAEVLPLCEDLNPNTVGNGDSCWSTCSGQCPNDVLKPGLAFDFDEIGPGHPGCVSHFECFGNHDRTLCHAVRAVEEWRAPAELAVLGLPPWPRCKAKALAAPASPRRRQGRRHAGAMRCFL